MQDFLLPSSEIFDSSFSKADFDKLHRKPEQQQQRPKQNYLWEVAPNRWKKLISQSQLSSLHLIHSRSVFLQAFYNWRNVWVTIILRFHHRLTDFVIIFTIKSYSSYWLFYLKQSNNNSGNRDVDDEVGYIRIIYNNRNDKYV